MFVWKAMASMIALNVALGRMAPVTSSSSGT